MFPAKACVHLIKISQISRVSDRPKLHTVVQHCTLAVIHVLHYQKITQPTTKYDMDLFPVKYMNSQAARATSV